MVIYSVAYVCDWICENPPCTYTKTKISFITQGYV